jgi:hypothetical protein
VGEHQSGMAARLDAKELGYVLEDFFREDCYVAMKRIAGITSRNNGWYSARTGMRAYR